MRLEPQVYRFRRSGVKLLAPAALALLLGGSAFEAPEGSLEASRAEERLLEQLDARLRAGDVDAVLSVFEDSLAGLALNPRLLNLKGVALAGQGRHSEAVLAFEQGLQQTLGFFELHLNLAISLEALGVTGRAMAEFEMAVGMEPESLDARLGLGRALLRFRRYERAASELGIAQEMAPDDARVLRALAELADATADTHGARTWWGRLEEIEPSADSARRLAELGGPEAGDGLPWYRRCLERDPEATDCAAALGALLLARGDAAAAIGPLQAVAAREDPDPEVLHNLLLALQITGNRPALEQVALERPPVRGESWGVVALARRADGDTEGALQASHRAVELAPASLDLVNLLAVLLDETGHSEAARERWEWILSQDPDHPEAARNLAARSR